MWIILCAFPFIAFPFFKSQCPGIHLHLHVIILHSASQNLLWPRKLLLWKRIHLKRNQVSMFQGFLTVLYQGRVPHSRLVWLQLPFLMWHQINARDRKVCFWNYLRGSAVNAAAVTKIVWFFSSWCLSEEEEASFYSALQHINGSQIKRRIASGLLEAGCMPEN